MADDINAFLVKRDDDGKVVPYEVDVLGIREEGSPLRIEILPTTLRSLKGLKDPNGDVVNWPIEDKVEYIRTHVTKPDFGSMSAEELEDTMTMWDLDMILITAVQKGGPMRQKGNGKLPTKRSGRSKKRSRN